MSTQKLKLKLEVEYEIDGEFPDDLDVVDVFANDMFNNSLIYGVDWVIIFKSWSLEKENQCPKEK